LLCRVVLEIGECSELERLAGDHVIVHLKIGKEVVVGSLVGGLLGGGSLLYSVFSADLTGIMAMTLPLISPTWFFTSPRISSALA